MRTAEIKRRFLAHFEANGHTVVPERTAAGHRRPEPAVRQRRHGAVRAVLPRSAAAAVPARGQRAEVHAHAGHRRGRQDQPARHVLPDERQLLVRRLLQGRGDPAGLGADHQAGRRRRLRPGPGARSGPPSTSTTTRRSTSGAASACRSSASCAAARRTTSGRWASPARAARARRSTTTAARSTAPRAARRSTRTATWSSGTSSSCSTSCADVPHQGGLRPAASCRRRTSTPAWAWSGWPRSCRASTTCTRSTRSARSWTRRWS